MKYFLCWLLAALSCSLLQAQITTDPSFPQQTETVTIIFDATKGNAALFEHEGPVYLHTGVISSESEHILDWQHTVTDWASEAPSHEMNSLGNHLYSRTIDINSYYGITNGEEVYRLAFVFRDANGGKVARATDGSDFFVEVYQPGLHTRFLQPTEPGIFLEIGESYTVEAAASLTDQMSLSIDGQQIYAINNNYFDYDISFDDYGKYWVTLEAGEGVLAVTDSFYVMVREPVNIAELPEGMQDGINILPDNTVILSLFAPMKEYAYVLSSWNDWELDPGSYMNQTPDGQRFWLEVGGLQGGQEHLFQYFVDGQIKIADPYSTKILDPAYDAFISPITYPGLIEYPYGRTSGTVTSFRLTPTAYQWNENNHERMPAEELVMYHIHPGEFTQLHTYEAIIERLDYLEQIKVNTVSLMPITEFEGNTNWGYNTTFYMAADKYYGAAYNLKRFIDECHLRGMSVIMDLNFDYTSQLSPLAQLYWNYNAQNAATGNPWFNSNPPHHDAQPADFNFDLPATQQFFQQVIDYWIDEFRFDGIKFVRSQGYTQKDSESQYAIDEQDAQRLEHLQLLGQMVRSNGSDLYVLFDDLENDMEAATLSAEGYLVLADLGIEFGSIAKGLNTSIKKGSYLERGLNAPLNVVRAQAANQQNLMYMALEEGLSQADYDLQEFDSAIKKMQQIATYQMAFPGPKTIHEFQELGIDQDYSNPCLECPQSPVWQYLEAEGRERLWQTYASMQHLRETEPTFSTSDFEFIESDFLKQLILRHNDMDANLIGNFETGWGTAAIQFPSEGVWYEYFTGDSIFVLPTGLVLNLEPGEFRLYTDKQVDNPHPDLISFNGVFNPTTASELVSRFDWQCYPIPAQEKLQFHLDLDRSSSLDISLLDLQGRVLRSVVSLADYHGSFNGEVIRDGLSSGMYLLEVKLGEGSVYYERVVFE